MLGWLASLFAGPVLSQLTRALNDAYKAKLGAQNDAARIAADENIESIKAQIALQHEQTVLLVAEQGHWSTRIMRPLFAYPVAAYYAKIFIWDKTLGLGATDGLSPELNQIAMVIIGSLFIHATGETISKALRGR